MFCMFLNKTLAMAVCMLRSLFLLIFRDQILYIFSSSQANRFENNECVCFKWVKVIAKKQSESIFDKEAQRMRCRIESSSSSRLSKHIYIYRFPLEIGFGVLHISYRPWWWLSSANDSPGVFGSSCFRPPRYYWVMDGIAVTQRMTSEPEIGIICTFWESKMFLLSK